MSKNDSLKDFRLLEEVVSADVLDFGQVVFRMVLDIYYNAGSPEFEDKVRTFQILAESHHRINEDKEYLKKIEETVDLVDDEDQLIIKERDPLYSGPVDKVEVVDYYKVFRAICEALGRHGILYRKERHIHF